jgi:hypothetical protein
MADLATLQARLAEAEDAYHKLVTGTKVVKVEHGDMRQEYTKAELGMLRAYIADLRSQIVAAGGAPDPLRRRGIVVDLPGCI